MEHWPGHARHERTQNKDQPKDKGKQRESSLWQWPHLEYGSIGRITLISRDRKVQWSSVVDTSNDTRWVPLSKPVKIFPETRSPRVNVHEHSARQRAEEGIQYLRTHFPDADFPGELLGGTLEADTREMRRLKVFDPFLGNLLEIIPCHHTQNESTVVFPMGELGRDLNISRFGSDKLRNMVFTPSGSPSVTFETPILQISSAVRPSEWLYTLFSVLLIRTHTSTSLLHLERSKLTRKLDITRSETGDTPIVDSRILATGPDIVAVNRSGKVYKCNAYHNSKAMQWIPTNEGNDDDHFWQLGITGRNDECFLASYKAVKHIDFRSAGPVADVFSLDHPSAVVTSFESPLHNYISRITTTSDVIWLDDRFRKRPLLSFKHYRNFDRTLRVLTASFSETSFSLLTSRRNSLVTLYDVNKGSDGLLHCNSIPSCLPHDGPMLASYDGHALVACPDADLAFFRLCQSGSVHRQDVRITQRDEDQPGTVQEDHVTHQWDTEVQALERQAIQLEVDFGPAGERHYSEVNLRGAYDDIFAIAANTEEDMNQQTCEDVLARLPNVWKDTRENPEGMLTALDVVSIMWSSNGHTLYPNFLASTNINTKQAFNALIRGQIATQKLAGAAQWHYNIQDTSIPALNYRSADPTALHEYFKDLDLVSEVEKHGSSAQRETEAREQLVLDLALSNDVYSARQCLKVTLFAAGEATKTTARPMETSYSEEPPEVKFGYLCPIRKSGAGHYVQDSQQNLEVSSPLGVRLLLAEWELGSDPEDYAYKDPYGLADLEDQPIPQYRKPPVPITQKKQIPQQPPAIITAATQPPIVHTAERAPPTQWTYSQQLEPGLVAASQEPMASTQVLPGPFGGRPAGGKKPVKKRIRGF